MLAQRRADRDPALTDPVRRLLEELELESLAGQRAGSLAHGDRRRLELAMALAGRPTMLLLDEPLGALDLKLRQELVLPDLQILLQHGTTALDVTVQQQILDLLKTLQQETAMSVLLITHDRYVLDRVATRTFELHDGVLQDLCAVARDLKAMDAAQGAAAQGAGAQGTGDAARAPLASSVTIRKRVARAGTLTSRKAARSSRVIPSSRPTCSLKMGLIFLTGWRQSSRTSIASGSVTTSCSPALWAAASTSGSDLSAA